MKSLPFCAAKVALIGIVAFTSIQTQAEMRSGHAVVKAVQGDVVYSAATGVSVWDKLRGNLQLEGGTVIKTGPNGTADLVLGYNGTVLRLTPNSILRLVRLRQGIAGEDFITETTLELLQGALAGSQRKLALPSYLDILTPQAVARIKGTEYYVRADGAVSVISGTVTVNYNLPGNQGDVRVTVSAGYTFDPTTGTVVPTTPEYLQNIVAHVITTRQNAEVYKLSGATIVVRPAGDPVSPYKGNNGVGNGIDPQPPGNPPVNDGPGTGPGNPGNKGGR